MAPNLNSRDCGIPQLQKNIAGKWKITIIWITSMKTWRFGELHRQIPGITQSTLTKNLRELEAAGMITRYVYRQVPPKVEYTLTEKGKTLIPILQELNDWSVHNLK
ncbi:winged helix-turn-helix transcriptional regulator [Oenococcus sicerae]|uniref:winged helix-turn-helix transcriptional regulator n=1 Tax=Oenococcus sicerae TaxID=2203724 RepID=UPI0010BB4BCC|nr:putative HTH-type transcriptional regulator YybR [Oenococcus sicerae]